MPVEPRVEQEADGTNDRRNSGIGHVFIYLDFKVLKHWLVKNESI